MSVCQENEILVLQDVGLSERYLVLYKLCVLIYVDDFCVVMVDYWLFVFLKGMSD